MVVYVDLATNRRGVVILAVLWPMITLSGVFLGLRLYSKLTRSRRLWWDDYLITVAWIFLLLSCSATTSNTRLGFGLHSLQVPLENLVTFGIQSNISGFASVIAVACSKTSFGLTLVRLTDGWIKWFIIGLLVVLDVTHCISAVFFWVSCNPPAKTWNVMLPGECWPTSVTVNYNLVVGACSAFCDFALALLPWRILLRFNMYNREKIGVAIAMSMGVVAGITCIVKMTKIPLLYDGDFSYNSLPLVLWGFIESALTIVAASIPMMRHLFKSLRHASDDLPHTSTTGTNSGGMRNSNNNNNNNTISGSRENRLAAARARANNRNANASRSHLSRISRLSHRSRHSQHEHEQQQQQQLDEGRPPRTGTAGGEDCRSDSSMLARHATAVGSGGGSTCTLGVSETAASGGGGGGGGEKGFGGFNFNDLKAGYELDHVGQKG